jgi:MFS family permease
VNAASFLAAIGALLMIRTRSTGGGEKSMRSVGDDRRLHLSVLLDDLSEGLRYVRSEKDVFRIMLLVALFSLFGIPFVTLLPVFAEDILMVGPKGLGILAGSSGVGSLAAALFIAFRGDIGEKGGFMSGAGLLFGVSLLFFSLSGNYYVSMVTLVFAGLGMVSFLAVANTFIQLTVPDVLRGRVMSVYALVFLGIAPVGNAVMGSIANGVGTDRAVSIGSSLCLFAVLLSWKHLRAMDKTD